MLKDNRLLIGLGLGLIIGAILLQLMNVAITGVEQNDVLTDSIIDGKEYSLEELRGIAESLDYNIIEKSVVLYTQSQLDDAILKANQSLNEEPVVKETEVEAPVDIENSSRKPVQEEIVESTSYLITIQSGMGTKDVTKLLLSSGLIDDAESFETELSRRELNNKIQVGPFEFTTKPSLTALINKITS